MNFERYYHAMLKGEQDLINTHLPICLFGAGVYGKCAKLAVEQLNKKVVCFCDNDTKKQGTTFCGVPVLSVDEVCQSYGDALIYVCLYNKVNVAEVTLQLKNAGAKTVLHADMLFCNYQKEVIKRDVAKKAIYNTMHNCYYNKKAFNIYMVGVIITQNCTLKCKECSHLITHFKNPKHYDGDAVIKSIKELAKSVDAIEVLTLLGGESLLHPKLIHICKEVSKISNILRIHVLTNGTIIPKQPVLEGFCGNITYLQLNDYAQYSNKLEDVQKECEKTGLVYDVYKDTTQWYKVNKPKDKKLNPEEIAQVYANCTLKGDYTEMIDGKFYLCGYAACAAELNLIPKEDCVDMLEDKLPAEEKRKQLEALYKAEYIHACGYCGFDFNKECVRAEQIN